jgi:hypothetical protein
LLRELHYLPIYLHIDFSDEAPALPLEQIADRVREELARVEAEFPQRRSDEKLWEYLHRNDMEIWTRKNYQLTPVFVFDHFEELFFRGAGERKWVRQAGRAWRISLRTASRPNSPRMPQSPEEHN